MARRLVKVASELNVGTETIVEFLNDNGYEVDNKPSTKIDDNMFDALTKEFYKDQALKERADEINLGRTKKEDVKIEPAAKPEVKKQPEEEVIIQTNVVAPAPKVEEKAPEPVVEEPVAEAPPKTEEKVEEEKVVKVEAEVVEGPKVIGKVDLPEKPKKKATKKEEKKPAAKKEKAEKVEKKTEKPAEVKAKTKKKEKEEPKEDFRETQKIKLDGPKVLGKIELPKPVEKKKEEKKPADKNPRRKRKRIVKPGGNSGGGNRGGNNRGGNNRGRNNQGAGGRNNRRNKKDDEPKVSEKELQAKIKATMAKMSGGSGNKSKRSKFRKDKRDKVAENLMEEEAAAFAEGMKLQISEFISVSELASLLDVSVTDIISKCMSLGVIVSINQRLDAEVIELVSNEYNVEVEFINLTEQEDEEVEEVDDPKDLEARPPIVTIMGHVDHGKTSLLDYIREANVIAGEMGGITQHIGAYEVSIKGDKKITFLDTPGHEAFTAMRARGAKVTDIAIIVIAADDAVMPQTKEAISHAQAAGVPMIFAINKIDRDVSNPDKIKEQLSQMNILVEDWGGDYQCQEVSAKTGLNVDELLEKVLLEAEMLELKANPNKNAIGTIVEASLDKGKGYVANILVQAGTLKVGDLVVSGGNYGRVKAMFDERNNKTPKAGPSRPVLMLGLDGAPQAGERFKVYNTDQEAKDIAYKRKQIIREQGLRTKKHITLDEIGRRLALGNFKELNLIIKGDVDGSIEATSDALQKLSTEEIQVNVIHKSVGQISETDIMLASASDAIIVGFQVRPSGQARKLAEVEGVEIRLYSIIYKAVEEIKAAMEGMLEPTIEEKVTCNVEVRDVFKISKIGTIAGCFVTDGKINRNTKVRLIRDGIVVYTGVLASLKRFKDDAKEVTTNMECGIAIKNYNNIEVGDIIEGFEEVEVKRTLNSK